MKKQKPMYLVFTALFMLFLVGYTVNTDTSRYIAKKNLKITKPVVGSSYTLGNANFTILAPNSMDYGSNLNNYSMNTQMKKPSAY